MKRFQNILLIIFLLISASSITQTKKIQFGKGLLNLKGEDNSWKMKVGARIQLLSTNSWNINSKGNYGQLQSSILIRRARLKFDGFVLSPKLKYKIELGFSNRDMGVATKYTNYAPRTILAAVIRWNFYKNFSLWVGQDKLPGNRERVISSGNMQFVDRSRLNKEFTIDRDLGLQLRHHFKLGNNFIVREMFAISQGEGRNIVTGNKGGYQYTGRLEFLPFGIFKSKGDYSECDLKREEKPKLAIGATYNFNDDAVRTKGYKGDYTGTRDISTIFVDAMFKYNGFSFMVEYADRKITETTSNSIKKDYSANVQAGYLFKNNIELAGRYTTVKVKGTDFSTNYYTLGLSKYIVGHKLKVQTDITYKDITSTQKGGLEYRLQLEIHF
ncbi:MAG: porin [Tenacibaculum sp.]|nr:porin [Tenacibaculum sp.]